MLVAPNTIKVWKTHGCCVNVIPPVTFLMRLAPSHLFNWTLTQPMGRNGVAIIATVRQTNSPIKSVSQPLLKWSFLKSNTALKLISTLNILNKVSQNFISSTFYISFHLNVLLRVLHLQYVLIAVSNCSPHWHKYNYGEAIHYCNWVLHIPQTSNHKCKMT